MCCAVCVCAVCGVWCVLCCCVVVCVVMCVVVCGLWCATSNVCFARGAVAVGVVVCDVVRRVVWCVACVVFGVFGVCCGPCTVCLLVVVGCWVWVLCVGWCLRVVLVRHRVFCVVSCVCGVVVGCWLWLCVGVCS